MASYRIYNENGTIASGLHLSAEDAARLENGIRQEYDDPTVEIEIE